MNLDDSDGHQILCFEADNESGAEVVVRFELIEEKDSFPWLRIWWHPEVASRWHVVRIEDGVELNRALTEAMAYRSDDEPVHADVGIPLSAPVDEFAAGASEVRTTHDDPCVGSPLPTAPGVNPQLSIMALAELVAEAALAAH